MPYFNIFGLEFEVNYFHVLNQHPGICLIAKFCKKKIKKCLNLEPKMPYLSIFGLEFEKIFYYLKSASLSLSFSKV